MQLHCTLCQLYMPIHSCFAIKQYRDEQLSCWAMLCQYFFLYNGLQFKFSSSIDIQYKVPGIYLFCYSYIFNVIAQKPNPGNMLDFFSLSFPEGDQNEIWVLYDLQQFFGTTCMLHRKYLFGFSDFHWPIQHVSSHRSHPAPSY